MSKVPPRDVYALQGHSASNKISSAVDLEDSKRVSISDDGFRFLGRLDAFFNANTIGFFLSCVFSTPTLRTLRTSNKLIEVIVIHLGSLLEEARPADCVREDDLNK